jgi:transcription antitermination factor NusG
MASLNVKVTDVTVEYNGEKYEVQPARVVPKKGDIAKVVKPWGTQVEGSFYPVINEDHRYWSNDPDETIYIDGEVRHASNPLNTVVIYRKKAVDPFAKFEVGKKVRLISGGDRHPLNGFSNGEEYEVSQSKLYHGRTHGYTVEIVKDGSLTLGFAKPEQLELVEHEPVAVGSRVKAVKDAKYGRESIGWSRGGQGIIRKGSTGTVVKALETGVEIEVDQEFRVNAPANPFFLADTEFEAIEAAPEVKPGDFAKVTGNWAPGGGTGAHMFKHGEIVEVIRVAATSSGPGMVCKSTETGDTWSVATKDLVKVDKPEVTFEVGNHVVVTKDNHEHREGDVLELVSTNTLSFDFQVRNLTKGRPNGYIRKEYIRKATFGEVEATKTAAEDKEFEPFKVGTKVRLIDGGDRFPLLGFESGEVYAVKTQKHKRLDDYGNTVRITDNNGRYGYAKPSQLEIVEDVAKFNVGDIVLVSGWTDYYGEIVIGKDSDDQYYVCNGEEREYVDESDLTMIAPKGNRVD